MFELTTSNHVFYLGVIGLEFFYLELKFGNLYRMISDYKAIFVYFYNLCVLNAE